MDHLRLPRCVCYRPLSYGATSDKESCWRTTARAAQWATGPCERELLVLMLPGHNPKKREKTERTLLNKAGALGAAAASRHGECQTENRAGDEFICCRSLRHRQAAHPVRARASALGHVINLALKASQEALTKFLSSSIRPCGMPDIFGLWQYRCRILQDGAACVRSLIRGRRGISG